MRSLSPSAFRLLAGLAVTVLFLGGSPPALGEDGLPLTEAQVACNRAQLEALVKRTSVSAMDGSLPPHVHSVLVTYANRFGFYEGLVVGMPQPRSIAELPPGSFGQGPEYQLGFHLNPTARKLLLNPERTPLEQISLTRETSTSSLVDPGSKHAVQLRVKPTLGSAVGPSPTAADLVIDNLAEPPREGAGFRPADTKPGRGLTSSGLTDLCHTRFRGFDREVFSILQRTLRVEAFDPSTELRYDTRIALFRQTDPGEFGADVYLVDPATGVLLDGSLRLGIRARADDSGALVEGRLSVGFFDPPGTSQLGGTAFIVRPLFGGIEAGYDLVAGWEINSGLAIPHVAEFDWRKVLHGTAWNDLTGITSSCGQGTADEIAATPREDPELEHLALVMGGGLTADPQVYRRVVEDVGTIRGDHPELANLRFVGSWAPDELILSVEPATFEAIKEGSFDAWDCLNDWYGMEQVRFAPASKRWVLLDFDGVFDIPTLAQDYAALADIVAADPNGIAADSSELCGGIDGTTYQYVVRVAGGDCPAGCTEEDLTYFTSEPGEAPVLQETWSNQGDEPRPVWADLCR